MIIIAFSENTSKILPRMLCRHFRHCAPIICEKNDLVMYQFITRNNIAKIHLQPRDIAILRAHGWKFVYMSPNAHPSGFGSAPPYSCVDLSKRALGIKSIFIQTPYDLYKHLVKK